MRYQNPHAGFPMNQGNMMPNGHMNSSGMVFQPGQNTMNMPFNSAVPPQGQFPQMVPVMTPNGIVMVPAQQVMQLQQQQQQFQQQQFIPQQVQNNNQAVLGGGRFTSGGGSQQGQEFPMEGNRFDNQTVDDVVEKISNKKSEPLVVKPVNHMFSENEHIKLGVMTNEIKSNQVSYNETIIGCDCFEEVIEGSIEEAYKEETVPLVTVRNFIVTNAFYRSPMNATIEALLSEDVKGIYKGLKVAYKSVTDKYRLNVLEALNVILTDAVNDYIEINSERSVSIDSFMFDFNDLLKVIRNYEEDLEDNLLDYMNAFVKMMSKNLQSLENKPEISIIPEEYTIAFLDKHLYETGLSSVTNKFTKIEKCGVNAFLMSLFAQVKLTAKTDEFVLVTMNKSIFKCMTNAEGDIFVKRYN